jgi:hypothetical protein
MSCAEPAGDLDNWQYSSSPISANERSTRHTVPGADGKGVGGHDGFGPLSHTVRLSGIMSGHG